MGRRCARSFIEAGLIMATMLDIATPRGQETLRQEMRAVDIFEQHYPACTFIPTPKDSPATIDCMIVRKGALHAIAEVKCRTMTLARFEGMYASQWLVTYDKIAGARQLADHLRVELWGLLYLVPDDLLLCKRLYRPGCGQDCGWLASFGVRKTDTQATVNGGNARRDNAFIDMVGCLILPPRIGAGS
jgi:hypothetical protein